MYIYFCHLLILLPEPQPQVFNQSQMLNEILYFNKNRDLFIFFQSTEIILTKGSPL